MDKPATQRDVIVWGCLACAYGAHGLVGWALIALAAITMVMPRPTPEAKEGLGTRINARFKAIHEEHGDG